MTTKTSTTVLTEDPSVCYFCKGAPMAVKRDASIEERETATGEIIEDGERIELLPICLDCDDHWYDGTEAYPALLPLSALDPYIS